MLTRFDTKIVQPLINVIEAIVSTLHLAVKFLTDDGLIVTVHVDQKATQECYMSSLKLTHIKEVLRSQAINVVTWVEMDKAESLDLG